MLGPIALNKPVVVRQAAYDSYLSGNPADAQPQTRGGLFLAGGGTDSDEGFRWFLDHAGGGDVVILRASGADGYNDYLQKLGPVDSVESIVLKQREASSDPYILERVRNADGIFFAGGDQSKYFQLIENSPLAQELNAAVQRGVPLGGTSAGLAILGEMSFSDRQGGVVPEEVLADPDSPKITLEKSFLTLDLLKGSLTDTHFSQRQRLGRLLPFMNNLASSGKPVNGLGVDEATAVLVEGDGKARVVGKHNAVFVTGPQQGQFLVQTLPPGTPCDLKEWGSKDFPRQTFVVRDHQVVETR